MDRKSLLQKHQPYRIPGMNDNNKKRKVSKNRRNGVTKLHQRRKNDV